MIFYRISRDHSRVGNGLRITGLKQVSLERCDIARIYCETSSDGEIAAANWEFVNALV